MCHALLWGLLLLFTPAAGQHKIQDAHRETYKSEMMFILLGASGTVRWILLLESFLKELLSAPKGTHPTESRSSQDLYLCLSTNSWCGRVKMCEEVTQCHSITWIVVLLISQKEQDMTGIMWVWSPLECLHQLRFCMVRENKCSCCCQVDLFALACNLLAVLYLSGDTKMGNECIYFLLLPRNTIKCGSEDQEIGLQYHWLFVLTSQLLNIKERGYLQDWQSRHWAVTGIALRAMDCSEWNKACSFAEVPACKQFIRRQFLSLSLKLTRWMAKLFFNVQWDKQGAFLGVSLQEKTW